MTQGPAIRKNGWSRPTVEVDNACELHALPPARWQPRRHLLLAVRARRLDEAGEQRMAVARRRAELRMELAGDEQRMRRQLDHLHQAVARDAGEAQARVHQLLQVAVVELVAMAVALA